MSGLKRQEDVLAGDASRRSTTYGQAADAYPLPPTR